MNRVELPEHWRSRQSADAVMAPSAIVVGGAGAALAIVAGLAPLAVVGAAVIAWFARVATLMPRRRGAPRIDPGSISDPWRSFVAEALDAQRRYRRAVESVATGPLRDRLVEIGDRIDAGVQECWRVARRGDALVSALGNLDAPSARRELHDAEQALKTSPGNDQEATVSALRAQVESADRLEQVARDAQSRLRLLDARLDEAVARAVELSVRAESVAELKGLGGDVDVLVSEMETLRVALDEAAAMSSGTGAGSDASL